MKKKLIISSIARYFEVIVGMVTALVLTPYLINQLGEIDYGLWILILSTLGWFSFIDLGFSSAIQRQLTFLIEKKDHHGINKIFSCALVLFGALGTIATLGLFILAIFPHILGIPEEKIHTSSIVLTVLCLKIFMSFLISSINGIFMGHIRLDIDANIGTITTILKAIIVFKIVGTFGIYGVVFATVFSDFLNSLIKIYYAKKLQKNLKFSWMLVKKEEIKELFSFSKHVISLLIARSINGKSDPVIISHVLSINHITKFNIADRLTNMIESLIIAIAVPLRPFIYKQVVNNATIKELENSLKMIISINCFVAGVFYVCLSVMVNDFIYLWVGEKFIESATLVQILIFAYLPRAISRPIIDILTARAQHKLISIANVLGAILNIFLSIILGYNFGLTGIVYSTVICFFLVDVIASLCLLYYHTGINIKPILINFIKLVSLYLVLSTIGDSIKFNASQHSWSMLIMNSGLIFILACFLNWLFIINKDAKNKLIEMIVNKSKTH